MSNLFVDCPLDEALTDIPKQLCPVVLGQFQKVAFWQKGNAPFTDVTIITAAAWATAVAAADGTKVVVTNSIGNFVIPQSTPVEQTADTNILGMPERQRLGNVNATGVMRSLSGDALAAMDKLSPYSQIQPGVTQLVCCFINSDNEVIYNKNAADLGFEVFGLVITDNDVKAVVAGLNESQINFYLKGGWSRDAAKKAVTAFDLLNAYPA